MLAMLGDQLFEIGKTDYQTLEEEIVTKWARHERVQGKVSHEALGSTEELLRIDGKLVMKPNSSLEKIKEMQKEQKPKLLTFGSGYAIWVIIVNIQTQKSNFTIEGNFRIENFTLLLERYNYGN